MSFKNPPNSDELDVPMYLFVRTWNDKNEGLRLATSYIWLCVVIGIPLLIVAWRTSWGEVFRSGEAAGFIAGAVVASFAENVLQQLDDGFENFKKSVRETQRNLTGEDRQWIKVITRSRSGPAIRAALFMAIIMFLLFYNIGIMIGDRRESGPYVDWVQVVAFVAVLSYLPYARFAMTKYDPREDFRRREREKVEKDLKFSKKRQILEEEGRGLIRRGYRQVSGCYLEEAVSSFKSAAEIFVYIENPGLQERALMPLGYTLISLRRLDEADSVMNARMKLSMTTNDGNNFADWPAFNSVNWADAYRYQFRDYLKVVRWALFYGPRSYGPPPLSRYKLLAYAQMLDMRRKFVKATAAYSTAAAMFEEAADPVNEAKALFGLANTLGAQDEFDDTAASLRRCVSLCDQEQYVFLKGIALANLGEALVRLRDFDNAEISFVVAAPIIRTLIERRGNDDTRLRLGKVLLSFGALMYEMGRLEEASPLMQEAVKLLG
jgi:tetratricopeptide (TPR) repeat protein